MMNRLLSCVALAGLLVLVSCSGDNPQPGPVPTPVQDTWDLELTVSPSDVYIDSGLVAVSAKVTRNGSRAPDGTAVQFYLDGAEICTFIDNPAIIDQFEVGTCDITTSEGWALLQYPASLAGLGSHTIDAEMGSNTDVKDAAAFFVERRTTDSVFELYSIAPAQGAYAGGEQVTLTGVNILAPVEVSFDVGSGAKIILNAEVIAVDESSSQGGVGTITVLTPEVNGATRSEANFATITVKVRSTFADEQTASIEDGFTYLAEPQLQIIPPLMPNTGLFAGGELITINGFGIRNEVRVTFLVGDAAAPYEAEVIEVEESDLATNSMGSIVVSAPDLTFDFPASPPQDEIASVMVEVDIDGTEALEQTVSGVYRYKLTDDQIISEQTWRIFDPSVYLVVPDFGSSRGGEIITIVGRNFRAEQIDTDGITIIRTAPAVRSVTFGAIEGQVLSVSPDGTQIQVMTPRFSTIPLTADLLTSITVDTGYPTDATLPADLPNAELNPADVTLANGFLVLADEPTPEITALAPIAGALDGGTLVTIFGHGFQFPVQVTFGTIAAEAVNLTDDQSPADIDMITCLSPDFSQQNLTPPVAVDVVVRNIETGLLSEPETFTYGDNLFVTGNTPSEGRPGDQVIIYGSGFEDPLQVVFVGGVTIHLEVVSVSGTELLVMFPAEADPTCEDDGGTFEVTLLEREGGAELGTSSGGSFTYLGNSPIVTNALPRFIQSFNDGDDVDPSAITISGLRFADELFVDVGDTIPAGRLDSSDVTVVDRTTIDIINLPAPNDFGLIFESTPCITDLGLTGNRLVPTAVNVTVTNFPGECADTLIGALIYEPEDDTCVVSASITISLPVFPDWEAPDPPASSGPPECSLSTTPLTITNTSSSAVDVQSIALFGRFYFTGAVVAYPGQVLVPGPTIPAFGSASYDLRFCPDVDVNGTVQGQVAIISNAISSPDQVNITAIEMGPTLALTPATLDFLVIGEQFFDIENTGTGDMTYALAETSDPDGVFSITTGATAGVIAAGGSVTIGVTASGAGSNASGELTITVAEADAIGAPAVVGLTNSIP